MQCTIHGNVQSFGAGPILSRALTRRAAGAKMPLSSSHSPENAMKVGQGEFTYEWLEHWARIPQTESGKSNGRTHGVVALDASDVMVFNQAQPGVLRFDSEGRLKNAWGDRFSGAHGMSLVEEPDGPALWLTDQNTAEVVKTTLDGRTLMNIQRPPHPVYAGTAKYIPTWVAVNEERIGGNGDIWVTDGYGSNFIHRYTKAGAYLSSINGTEGKAGAFACPHGIAFVPKAAGPELYIADRANHRVQVYDPEGNFKRVFGADYLTSPCGFVQRNGIVYVPELYASLSIIDEHDREVIRIGDNAPAQKMAGWPNLPANQIRAGLFNSPHGMAVDKAGNLYMAEWIVGGRITKLARA
jgi:sugar lactone lactonase YvrE